VLFVEIIKNFSSLAHRLKTFTGVEVGTVLDNNLFDKLKVIMMFRALFFTESYLTVDVVYFESEVIDLFG